mmetsp:Transcript_17861/g.60893  ORF Transcript_17861/g.60893 Transcript_17861/m.60893 type:complete len:224 (+) Transcript_17861:5747-6418(+)
MLNLHRAVDNVLGIHIVLCRDRDRDARLKIVRDAGELLLFLRLRVDSSLQRRRHLERHLELLCNCRRLAAPGVSLLLLHAVNLLVQLRVLAVDAPALAREVVARLLPRERVFHAPGDLAHTVIRQRDDDRRERRRVVEVRREHERHAVHEEKQQEVDHVLVRVRDGRRHDALAHLERGHYKLGVVEHVQGRALGQVSQPAVVLDDGDDACHEDVGAVEGVHLL